MFYYVIQITLIFTKLLFAHL